MQTPFSPYAPLRNALSRSLEADESRKREGDAQEAATIKDSLNKIASETQIPANILFAIAETSGADTPERVISAARNAGNRLSGAVRDGKSYEDALSEAIGDDKIAGGMLMRAKQLADQFDPLGPLDDQSRPETANALRDLPAVAASTALEGLGAGAGAALSAAEGVLNPIKGAARVARAAGLAPEGSTAGAVVDIADPDRGANARAAGDLVGAPVSWRGEKADQYLVSKPQAQAMRDTQITGSIFDPASLDMSDDASLRGWLGHGASVVGSMLPVILTKSPAAAAGIGAAMGAGDAGTDAGAFVEQMAAEVTQNGTSTKLYDESQVYRDMIDNGVPHAQALEQTKIAAKQVAEVGAAAVAGLGGAATNRLIRGAEQVVGGLASRGARAAGGAALSGLEEGVQEVSEGMIGRAGAGLGAGVARDDITEGTGQEFIMGAMGGAVPGGIAGAMSQGPTARGLDDDMPPAQSVDGPAPVAPPGLPGPARMLGLPAPEAGPLAIAGPKEPRVEPPQSTSSAAYGADPATMRDVTGRSAGIEGPQTAGDAAYGAPTSTMRDINPAPSGPLTSARTKLPGPVLGDAKPGDVRMLTLQERPDAPVPVKIVGEDALGVKAVDTETGEDMHIPRSEIESGAVRLALPPPVNMPEEAKSVQDQAANPPALPAPPARLALAGPAAGLGEPASVAQPDQSPALSGIRPDGNGIGQPAGPVGGDNLGGPSGVAGLVGQPAEGPIGQGPEAGPAAPTVQRGSMGDGAGVSDADRAEQSQPSLNLAPEQKGAKEMMQRDYPPPAAYGKGEVLVTSSGRATAPFPELKFGTPARSRNNVKRVNDWFMAEALAEAQARGDDFAARMLSQDQGKGDKTPQSSLQTAADYLGLTRNPIGAHTAENTKTGKSSRNVPDRTGAETKAEEQNSDVASKSETNVPKDATDTPSKGTSKVEFYKPQPKAEQDATEDWWLENIPAQREAILAKAGWTGDPEAVSALARAERWDEMGPTIRLALTNIRLAMTKAKADDAPKPDPKPKAEKTPEAKDDAQPTGKAPLSEAIPASVKNGKTGDETGVLLADQAYAFIKAHMADGEPRTAGMGISHVWPPGVRGPMSFAFDDDNSYKGRFAKPAGKVFVRGPNGLHSFWFSVADIDAEIAREKARKAEKDAPAKAKDPKPEPEPKPEPAPEPEAPAAQEEARADDVGVLTKAERDRLAALRDRFRSKIKTQLNSGLDPELVAVAAEMAAIYIKAGARRFRDLVRAMVEDLELPFATIQPYARSAYNQVRGDKELADEDVTGMDDDKAVIAEIRAIMAEEKAKADAEAATPAEGPENGAEDEPEGDRGGDPVGADEGRPESGEGAEASEAEGAGESAGGNGGSGNRIPDADGPDAPGSVDGGSKPVSQALTSEPVKGENPGNYVLSEADAIGTGTDGEKIRANIAAIRAIKAIEAENRYATREEQAALAKYVGWGGLKTVFDPRKTGASDQYGRAQAELKELLTKEEYEAAFDSVKNAHYTAPGVVKAMWEAMAHFGFTGGRALEPTVGVGNFIGLQPEGLAADTEWHGAELDSITGRIAKHLYPDARIMAATGFEAAPFARGVFDIAIGNPPFGGESITIGREKDLLGLKIHNYIIAKTGRHLRPGGIMAMVVTHRFLDTANDEARSRLAQDFRFMGAIRLPNDAFLANAGTEVVTDIVFFQKLKDGDQPDMSAAWLDTNGKLDGDIRVNRYFAENPGNILGRSAMDGTMYAHGGNKGEEYTVHGDGRDLTASLSETIKTAFAKDAGALGSRSEALEAAVAVETISTLPLGGMMLDENDQVVMRDEDGPNGEHRVSVVTAETLWKAEAAEWGAVHDRIAKLKDSLNTPAVNEHWDDLMDETAFLYTGGTMRKRAAKPTQAVLAIYEMIDAGIPSVWGKKQREGLAAAKTASDTRRLNKDGYQNVKAQLGLRQKMLSLIRAERTDADQAQLKAMRAELKKLYDAYVKKFGYLNASENRRVMRSDNGVEMGLEAKYKPKDDDGPESAEPAAILEKRVYFPHRGVESADNPADGLVASIIERGRVDIPFIAKITGMTPKEVIEDLTGGDEPRIFLNPETNSYEDAESYLSGNVKAKLKVARDEGLPEHVKALEAVQPAPLPRERITPAPRSLWIPPEVFEEFMGEIGVANPKVSIFADAGSVSVSGMVMASMPDFGRSFQHDRADSLEMFRALVTGKPMKIYDGRGEDRVLNEGATREVNAIIERMGREFEKWAYQNSERTQKIVDAYNEKMNTHVERKFDGVKYLRTVGLNPELLLRNSQKNGSWRMMITETSLMHHIVGAGKTFTAIVAVMERKRMGLSNKPMVVVPNHLVEQWAADFRFAYPGAKLLAATKDDFEKQNRRRLLSRIATGDYDAIVIGHSSLKFIENSPESTSRIISEQVEMLKEVLEEARRGNTDKRTLTQIRNAIKKYDERLKRLSEKAGQRKDELGVSFEDMGIDYLVVDEAHEFKNLEYQSGGERLVGMNSPQGSQKAFDLYVKTRTLLDANDNGPARNGVGFLTGTPISNSLVEAYSMMKYLIPRAMKQRGVAHFDSWAASYVQAETRFEYNATQKLVERRVMSRLVNLSSLSQLYREFADVIMSERLHEIYAEQIRDENARDGTSKSEKFPVPNVKDGGRQLDSAPASPEQREYTEYLASRMIGMKGAPDRKEYAKIDNALWVLSDARKASIDIRTVDPEQGRHPDSKVARASARIFDKWKASAKVKGTQLVFSDLSTPKKAARSMAVRFLTDAINKTGIDKKTAKARAEGWADAKENLSAHWEAVIEQINRVIDDPMTKDETREDLIEWMASDTLAEAAGAMLTFDTGFSVYDDLKAALVEKGIPAAEIAFIHDFDTDKGKAKLFADVNSGKVRILIGSTPKMGAGTNVQKRLVALHHMDSPWRPSDVEQREGRIIRAGNDLYAADPEGFEVDIWAYSTEGTSDVVLWQVLERKARAIEQFLNGALDSMDEEGGDSDDYAEFMAQSTGNPVFLLKLETERSLLAAESEVAGLLMGRADAKSFLRNFTSRMAGAEAVAGFAKKPRLKTANIAGDPVMADPSDLAPALAAYREKYMAAEQAHEEAVEKVKAENAILKAEGKRQSALPKFEMDAPGVMAAEVQAASSYARLIRKALLKLKDMRPSYGSGDSVVRLDVRFDGAEDVKLTLSKAPTAIDPRKSDYSVTLRYGDEGVTRHRGGRQVTVSTASSRVIDPVSSPNLWSGFYPAAIDGEIEWSKQSAEGTITRLNEERPEMERRAAMEIDTDKVAEIKQLLGFYKADVAIAEAEREKEIKGKPQNRYEILDAIPGRRFGRETGSLINEQLSFNLREGGEFDGRYVGTGIGAGSSMVNGGKEPRRGFFEAINEKTGQRAIFEAMHSEYAGADKITLDDEIDVDGDGWSAIRVMIDPARGDARKSKPDTTVLTRERRAERKADEPKASNGPSADEQADMRETLEREMKRMNIPGRVSLRVMKFLTDGLGNPVQGMFHWAGQDAGKIDVSLSEHGGDKKKALATLRHELIHALRSPEIWGGEFGLFTKDEWSALVRAARADIGIRDWVRKNYAELDAAWQTEEMVAEYVSKWAEKQDEARSGVLSAALAKARDMILAMVRAVVPWAAPRLSGAEVARAIMAGQIGARGPSGPGGGFFVTPRLRKEVKDMLAAGHISGEDADLVLNARYRKVSLPGGGEMEISAGAGVRLVDGLPQRAKDLARHALTQAMSGNYNLMALVPGRALFEELGKNLISARSYLSIKDKMDTVRNEWHGTTDKVSKHWRKLIAEDSEANSKLMDIMHESTIWQVDPTKEFKRLATVDQLKIVQERGEDINAAQGPVESAAIRAFLRDRERRVKHASLRVQLNALPANFQSMYSEVRDHYVTMQEAYDAALKENIEKAAKITIRRAERKLQAALDEIDSDGDLTDAEKDAARDKAIALRDKTVSQAKQGAAARSVGLRKLFESNRIDGPYFPLARFGQFFVTVKDKSGNIVSFSRFETALMQEKAAESERKAGNTVEIGVLAEKDGSRGAVDPRFVAEVEAMLAGADVPFEVMDAIWQKWLDTLPEVSARRNRIHRKGTEGFTPDALRAFASNMFHSAHQLARLQYGMDLQDALDEAELEARRAADPNRAMLVVNEMGKRHAFIMNPKGASWAQFASSAAFIWYLAATPAAALVNLTQTTVIGIPMLANLHKGEGSGIVAAADEIQKAGRQFVAGRFKIEDHPDLTEAERAAMKEAYDRGVIDKSQAHDLAGVAETGVEYKPRVNMVMEKIAFLFHHTERANREVTFLAAYRMARKGGMDHEAAITAAAQATWKTHFDYQNTSRPRFMQGDAAKVLFTFRNYQVNMIWRLFRDVHQAFKGEDEATRKEARRQLFGITGMMMLHAGVSGTWLFGITMMIAGLFFGGGADEAEAEFKDAIVDLLGPTVGGAIWYGPAGQMTGIDLTSRIGMPDLWFRSSDRDLEGEDAYNYWLQQTVGPVPGILEGFFRGAQLAGDGNWYRGIETAAPKAIRDAMKSVRYATDGVETMKGDPLLDTVGALDVLKQFAGFTPAQVAQQYELNSLLKNREARIIDRRQKLMARAAKAIMDGKPLPEDVVDGIDSFNTEFPEYPITPKTLKRSIQSRIAASERMEGGISLNARLNDRLRGEVQ